MPYANVMHSVMFFILIICHAIDMDFYKWKDVAHRELVPTELTAPQRNDSLVFILKTPRPVWVTGNISVAY